MAAASTLSATRVFRFEIVDVGLAIGAGQGLHFHHHGGEVISQLAGPFLGIETFLQLGVLGGDTDRAATGVTMVAIAGFGAQFAS